MSFRRLLPIILCSIGLTRTFADAAAPDLFDPTKYMRVSEVRPGMKGYGVSVFSGTKLERFDVEVVSVLKNFNPKDDVVLIRCAGQNLEHTGAIAGMSGSPIYLMDDAGHERMVGAFAYGWPLVKDPIAGVQPIEYMLALPDYQKNSTTAPGTVRAHTIVPTSRITWKLNEIIPMPGMKELPKHYPLAAVDRFEPNPSLLTGDGDESRLQPLATPLMVGGLSPRLIEQFAPIFHAYGLSLLQAGGGGASDAEEKSASTQPTSELMQPGSVLAAPLLTGDTDMTAVGTCTDVIGDRIFGFGHPFNNEGSINLPFGAGEINGIVAELRQSFKLGSMTRTIGTLTTDQSVGISGHIGKSPKTMPIDLQIKYSDGSVDQHYHFDSVIHSKMTPMLSVAAIASALTGQRELPENYTIDYDLNVQYPNGKAIKLANALEDANPAALFLQVAAPLTATSSNPYQDVMPERISGTINVDLSSRTADVLSVNVPKLKYKPGEMLTADLQYRPFHSAEATMSVDMQLPHDLPDGPYQLVISGWQRYVADELQARPFRFDANSINEVFDALQDFESIRHDALYIRLVRQADGVALGRSALPRLPASIRQVMLDAGRSDTSAFVSSDVKIIPTKLIIDGAADFAINIETPGRSEANKQNRSEMPQPVQPPASLNPPKHAGLPGAPPQAPPH